MGEQDIHFDSVGTNDHMITGDVGITEFAWRKIRVAVGRPEDFAADWCIDPYTINGIPSQVGRENSKSTNAPAIQPNKVTGITLLPHEHPVIIGSQKSSAMYCIKDPMLQRKLYRDCRPSIVDANKETDQKEDE